MADPGAKVELLVLDVDGVLTDGSIIYDDEGRELKRFFVGDGLGIKAWLSAGFGCGVLSSRSSPAVERRMRELGVTEVVQGARDKSGEIGELCGRLGRSLEATAFMGDDLPDLPAMRRVGLAIAPADADGRVREAAGLVTAAPGGRGAVREAIERLLRAKGLELAELVS